MAGETVWIVAGAAPENWPAIQQSANDFFIGVDRGAWHLQQKKLPMVMAVGDFDSLTAHEKQLLEQTGTEMVELPAEKDDTDTQIGLQEALARFPEAAEFRLIGATGGRIDHFLANLWLPLESRFQPLRERLRIMDSQNTVCYFGPGEHQIEPEAGRKYLAFVGLVPLEKLTLKNVKYPLEATDFRQPISLASNEFLPNQVATFSFTAGVVAVIQSADQA